VITRRVVILDVRDWNTAFGKFWLHSIIFVSHMLVCCRCHNTRLVEGACTLKKNHVYYMGTVWGQLGCLWIHYAITELAEASVLPLCRCYHFSLPKGFVHIFLCQWLITETVLYDSIYRNTMRSQPRIRNIEKWSCHYAFEFKTPRARSRVLDITRMTQMIVDFNLKVNHI